MGRAKRDYTLTLYNKRTRESVEKQVPYNVSTPVYVLKEYVRDELNMDLEVWRLEYIR